MAKSLIPLDRVQIHEVGPRDGFQNVRKFIPTDRKLEIIDGLVGSGLDSIQLTSFVSPKAVPQMRDAAEVVQQVLRKHGPRRFSALVPNHRGAQDAYEAGLRKIVFVISISETHNRENTNRSREESWRELARVLGDFPDLSVQLAFATVFSCPFEGEVPLSEVTRQVRVGRDAGLKEICLSDTMGSAHPRQVHAYLSAVKADCSEMTLLVHFHDTEGMAMVNCFIAAQLGYEHFETSVAGLGGCPFAPGAAGNLATEDLVNMFEVSGVSTEVDLRALNRVAGTVRAHIEPSPSGRLVQRPRGAT